MNYIYLLNFKSGGYIKSIFIMNIDSYGNIVKENNET